MYFSTYEVVDMDSFDAYSDMDVAFDFAESCNEVLFEDPDVLYVLEEAF